VTGVDAVMFAEDRSVLWAEQRLKFVAISLLDLFGNLLFVLFDSLSWGLDAHLSLWCVHPDASQRQPEP
jgi:hypothetical protein